jgi:hypothetical protein
MQGISDRSVAKPYSLFDRLWAVPDDLGLTGEQRERWQAVVAGLLTDITLLRGHTSLTLAQRRRADRLLGRLFAGPRCSQPWLGLRRS